MRFGYELNIYLMGLLLIVTVFVSYCEYFIYYKELFKCQWPILETSSNPKNDPRIMILADTHLLGRRNGHWFDKLRREWQMYRAFQTSIELHSPDVVVFLGDLFDEGKWCSDSEFAEYVKRFEELFHVPEKVSLIIAAGNHDIGFHYRTHPHLVSRFDEAFRLSAIQFHDVRGIPFITVNSIAMEGDDCFLCKSAREELDQINKKLRCIKQDDGSCRYRRRVRTMSPPVLLQHYPMYRTSDAHCNESDEAPASIKMKKFKESWDCLSEESTRLLMSKIEPRLIFSGHTHHGCLTGHDVVIERSKDDSDVKRTILEHNVASFSWRNKVNPTFIMMTISQQDHKIHKCHLPDESHVKWLYCCAVISILMWTVIRYSLPYYKESREKSIYLNEMKRDLQA